jgi:hypothetical protein
MTGHSGRASCRAWVGIAGALLLSLLAPSSARAACGDHVHFGANAAPSKSDPSHKPVVPCHGPNCSQRENDPLPAPVPPPSTANPNDHASLVPLAALTGGDGVEWLALSEPSFSSPCFSPIFHPPRPAAR